MSRRDRCWGPAGPPEPALRLAKPGPSGGRNPLWAGANTLTHPRLQEVSVRTLFPAAAALFTTLAAAAEPPAPPAPVVIRNVTIIDVEAGKALPPADVFLSGDRITAIGQPPAERPETTIDGTGLFLIPGLFDAHVHYVSPESYGPLMIANGVTFVRDLGGFTDQMLELRRQLNTGEILGPRMICTGAIIDGESPVWPFSEECKTEEDARAAVRKLKAAGVDQIKVYSKL